MCLAEQGSITNYGSASLLRNLFWALWVMSRMRKSLLDMFRSLPKFISECRRANTQLGIVIGTWGCADMLYVIPKFTNERRRENLK
jgi:hypothetical protein